MPPVPNGRFWILTAVLSAIVMLFGAINGNPVYMKEAGEKLEKKVEKIEDKQEEAEKDAVRAEEQRKDLKEDVEEIKDGVRAILEEMRKKKDGN